MIIRVRNNSGLWRVELNESSTKSSSSSSSSSYTTQDVLHAIQLVRPNVVYTKPLSFDVSCQQPIDPNKSLYEQNIHHGTMIYCMVDSSTTIDISSAAATTSTTETAQNSQEEGTNTSNISSLTNSTSNVPGTMRRIIDKDGSIKLIPIDSATVATTKGFRKGLLPLRDMKMHWTLSDFMLLDAQYEFKIQRQENAICQQVSLDIPSISNFQLYVQQFAFAQKRIGYLYGKFVPVVDAMAASSNNNNNANTSNDSKNSSNENAKMKCIVEAIYEPPQDVDVNSVDGFVLHDDDGAVEEEQIVNQIASLLGLRRVGWIFGHEYRKDYTLSSAEIIMAAEYQLEAADGVHETPFVTVTVAPSSPPTGGTNDTQVSVEAFQVSQQCMAMVAEQALDVDRNDPKVCIVNETYTAIQEGKASPTVENSFFLTVVPIVQHTSETFIAEFPRLNRSIYESTRQQPSTDAMKIQLSKSGTAGWTFIDRLSDFNLLIFLSKFLDVSSDYPKICNSIIDRHNTPLDDGYKLIIKSLAGMDGSY